MVSRVRHLLDRTVERRLIDLGRPREAAQLAYELQRRSVDLVMRRRRFEVVQSLDVSAHDVSQALQAGPPDHRPGTWPKQVPRKTRVPRDAAVACTRTDRRETPHETPARRRHMLREVMPSDWTEIGALADAAVRHIAGAPRQGEWLENRRSFRGPRRH